MADLDAVLFDVDGALLTLVATDRHRMAVSAVPVIDRSGPSGQLSVPRAELGRVAVLGLDPAGALRVVDPATPGFVTAVNRGFLLDALDAAPTGQLVLDPDGPLHPLAIRHPTDPNTYSVLIPVCLP